MKTNPSTAPARLRPILKKWKPPTPRRQGEALRHGISLLAELPEPRARSAKNRLPEQPFDALLLENSPLFARSRSLFLQSGGSFSPALVSSPRTLGSPTLLDPLIEYSPVERELIWAATDPKERQNLEHLLRLRTYVTSLFHEQNHRILWSMLPPAPHDVTSVRRYLNFAESLVIALDMALGDEFGTKLASLFYLIGVTYDPGTDVRKEIRGSRDYRNYLQAATFATYLNLELYEPKEIEKGIRALFPGLGDLAVRAARRSANLDRAFVWKTNPVWQKKHASKVIRARARAGQEGLKLSNDPMDNREHYLFAEKWFEAFGL